MVPHETRDSVSATATRREAKKQAVRQALEEAALRLFDRNGFAGTTVDQIASEAQVSRSTFFRYFTSKEALLFDAYETGVEVITALIVRRPANEPPLAAYENALVELALNPDNGPDRELATLRQKIIESDDGLKARRDAVTHNWRFRIAQALATRDGKTEPGRMHQLAASVGVAVAQRIAELFVEPGSSGDTEEMIRSEFALLRDLAAATPGSP